MEHACIDIFAFVRTLQIDVQAWWFDFICKPSTVYIVLISFELHRLRTFGAKFNIWLNKIDFKLTIYAKVFNSLILRFYVQNILAIFIFVALICPSRLCLTHYHNQLQKWSAIQTWYVSYNIMKLVLTR